MPDVVPFWTPGESLTCHAGTAVTGGRFVRNNGARVDGNVRVIAFTANGQKAFGVAARDKGVGEKVMVFAKPGQIVPVRAGAALTAEQAVMGDATGQAIPYVAGAGVHIAGYAVDDAANGTDAPIQLMPGHGGLT
jgi:Uncharacterized conserved protein (DUF2190)